MSVATLFLAGVLASLTAAESEPLSAAVAPCTSPAPDCTEWVMLGGGPARSMIYRTFPLDALNSDVKRALVLVHGANRNADHYFATATAAAFLAGSLRDSVVIAPLLRSDADTPAPEEVVWSNGGDSWRAGGKSTSHPSISSFDFLDEILSKLASRAAFPNLKAIVVAGHSAGGQFATRYAMANRVHETVEVAVTYIVANPSSYAWPADARPVPVDDADPAAAREGWDFFPDDPEKAVHTNFTYAPFDASLAADYNQWPLGLENRTGYTAEMTDDQLRKQLVERPTTYLLGQLDTLPLGGFDSSPAAMAQGPTRRARGEAFVKYVNEHLGARHEIRIVSQCGHSDRCIFTADEVRPVIFPGTADCGTPESGLPSVF